MKADRRKVAATPIVDPELAAVVVEHLTERERLTPPESERIFARVRKRLNFSDGVETLRAEGGDWRVLRERVYLKVLKRDDSTGLANYLVRYLPGGRVERHPQRYVEECMLVAGDLKIDDIDMQVGDLQFAPPGCDHGPLSTVNGALVFVRGILKNVPEQRVM
jgi:hypothetical protein